MSHPLWNDDYWLLLMKLYMRKPEGVKPMYSRGMVDLSLELHIPPQFLYSQMFRLRRHDTPRLRRLFGHYEASPRRLARDVATLRRMRGFASGGGFWDGVAVVETFERDFRPIEGLPEVKPVMLIMALDLYFRLTPATMVAATPEVAELARLMKIKPDEVVGMLDGFQACDPYLRLRRNGGDPLYEACREVWQRYGNGEPETLASLAAQLKEYF